MGPFGRYVHRRWHPILQKGFDDAAGGAEQAARGIQLDNQQRRPLLFRALDHSGDETVFHVVDDPIDLNDHRFAPGRLGAGCAEGEQRAKNTQYQQDGGEGKTERAEKFGAAHGTPLYRSLVRGW